VYFSCAVNDLFIMLYFLYMTKYSQSVYYFSFYLLLSGALFFIFPNQVLAILGIQTTTEPWIHLLGILTFILGLFFFYMGRNNSREFAYISLFGRVLFILGVISVVILYNAPVSLLLFGVIDLFGFLWTLSEYLKA
jgi:hypothetical protein